MDQNINFDPKFHSPRLTAHVNDLKRSGIYHVTQKTTKEGTVSTDSAVAPLPKSWSQTLKGKFWGKITLLQQKKKEFGKLCFDGAI